MRKLITVVLVVALVFSLGIISYAQEPVPEELPNKTVVVNSPVYYNPTGLKAAAGISNAYSSMTVSGSTITCKATTIANGICDKIGANFELQKKVGTSWQAYSSGSDYAANSARYEARYVFSITSGTYRLKAVHNTYTGSSLYSSRTTYTTSLTI